MKRFLAIIVCKLLRRLGSLAGRGSSLPGKYALRICPDVLARVRLPDAVIAVTGSNGKTSTVEMIAAVLRAGGRDVVYNAEGSNQIEGVATLVLSHCTPGGRMRGDVLLLECDERYARLTFRYFHPTCLVVTNLYRDQLTRNGHPEWVFDAIRSAIHPETTLLLNADDPLVSRFALGRDPGKVRWFGVERCPEDDGAAPGVYDDGARCPVCRGKMVYAFRHYHHIGGYRCTQCGYERRAPDFSVTKLDLARGTMTIGDGAELDLSFRSICSVYNVLAAWSACALAGIDGETMAAALSGYTLKNGRTVSFLLGGWRGTLLTSKHENSVAYDTNLSYIRARGEPCAVLVLVDAISRKYFTGETSWLWDVDFGLLDCGCVERVVLCGRYVNDLALRFEFTGVDPGKIACFDTAAQAAEALKNEGSGTLYALTCFSDRDKLLDLTGREET